MRERIINHTHIAQFAERFVAIPQDQETKCHELFRRMSARLQEYEQANPESGLVKFVLSGPVAKGIALRSTENIDVALYVTDHLAPSSAGELHAWLLGRLRTLFPSMLESPKQPPVPAIALSLPDAPLPLLLTPVYDDEAPDGGGRQFAKETGQLVRTSIPLRIALFQKRKDAQPVHFAQVYRLLEWWAEQRRSKDPAFHFKSFLVELLCVHLADRGVVMSDYPAALEDFFSYVVNTQLKERVAFFDYYSPSDLPSSTDAPVEIFDPINPRNNVAVAYDDADRRYFVDAAAAGLDAIETAKRTASKNDAVACWRSVLGDSFDV